MRALGLGTLKSSTLSLPEAVVKVRRSQSLLVVVVVGVGFLERP
jgi:hypothetical protein